MALIKQPRVFFAPDMDESRSVRAIGAGYADRYLTSDEVRDIVHAGLESIAPDGKRILFIIPDGTRTMPMRLESIAKPSA